MYIVAAEVLRFKYNQKKMKTTQYFQYTRQRSDRAVIRDEWIERVIPHFT